ncbi:MAG: tetratricopeptide repeat protein [Pseudonocardiaceae bacterium]
MRTVITDAIDRTTHDVTTDETVRFALRDLLSQPRRDDHPVPGAVVPVSGTADNQTLAAAIGWWVEMVNVRVADHPEPLTAFQQLGVDAEQVTARLEVHVREEIARLGGPGGPLERLHDRLVTADRHAQHMDALAEARAGLRHIAERLDKPLTPDWQSGDLFALPPASPLAGRENDMAALMAHVTSHRPERGHPLVIVIHGMPGVGKTSLATALAWRLSQADGSDVPFVELHGWALGADGAPAPPADPGSVLGELLVACGVTGGDMVTSTQMRATMWRSEVARHGFPAIILDNARNADQVRALLPNNGHCVVIVTSRIRLTDLDGKEHRCQPLVDAATATLLATAREDSDQAAIAQLVTLTAGLPLANDIVLAALRRHEDLPMSFVADEFASVWDGRGASDDSSPLQPVALPVWAAFELSYRRLQDPERRSLCLLARQPGRAITTFGLAALLDIPETRAGFLLSELAAANLIERRQGAHWRFHDLIAAYVSRRALSDLDEQVWSAASRRLVTHQVAMSSTINRNLPELRIDDSRAAGVSPSGQSAKRWLLTERENLTATLDALSATDDERLLAQLVIIASRIGPALWRYSFTDDAELCHEHALAITRRIGDRSGEAASLLGLGYVARIRDRYEAAEDLYGPAFQLFHDVGDRPGAAESLTELGHIARLDERYDVAVARFEQARNLYRDLDDQRGEADCLIGLGEVALLHGEIAESRDHYTVALGYCQEAADRGGEADCWWGLGEVARTEGLVATASEHCQRALRLNRDLGHRLGEADTLRGLGEIARMDGQLAHSRELLEQAVLLHRTIGDRMGEADGLRSLGQTHADGGDRDAAHASWEQAALIYQDIGSTMATTVRRSIAELTADDSRSTGSHR